MVYTDRDRVRHVLAPDGILDGTAASLGDPEIDEGIARVESRVDTYLRRFYTVPLVEPVPAIVRDLTTDLAAYDLTLAYYKSTDISDQDPVVRRYRDARDLLNSLASGVLVLDVLEEDTTTDDDPVVYNPEPMPRSPEYGFEVKVIREYGPWGSSHG